MEWITDIFSWITLNPTWAGLVVMTIAFAESLALVGLFLPGAVMMFGIGALVGSGAMALWPTLLWAAAGAIAGDGVSFWLGHRYHQQIRVMWPFRTHPELLNRSIQFFHRHGGKSVLLGRFIGPIRPVIPVVAGMMAMSPRQFLLVNVLSGILWAPVYVLPGMLFASSLGLAAEAATRLAVMAGTLLLLLVVTLWLLRHSLDWFHHHTYLPLRRLLAWSRLHPIVGEIPQALLDPRHPEARGLTLLALLLLMTTLGLAMLWSLIGSHTLLAHLDIYLFHALQGLRTPQIDTLIVAITQLGDRQVIVPLFAVVALWLALRRRWHTLFHWVAALLFILALNLLLQQLVTLPRPLPQGFPPFPSGHTGYSLVLYGFLALLIGHELQHQRWRVLLYGTSTTLVTLIAFSRLYLGSDWFSEVLGEVGIALLWVSLLGLAYRHHPARALPVGQLWLLVMVVFGSAYGWHHHQRFTADLQRYAPQRQHQEMAVAVWWQGGWSTLPRQRIDLRDYRDHPLTLQYSGELPPLREALHAEGWSEPERPNLINWIKWLNAEGAIASLPVMPQVHDGRNEGLLLVKPDGRNGLWALRLWPSHYTLQPESRPLWLGNSSRLSRPLEAAIFYAPRTELAFSAPYDYLSTTLQRLLPAFEAREVTTREGELFWLLRGRGSD